MRRKNWRVSGTWAHQFFPEDILPRFGTAPRAEAGGYLHNIAVYKTVRQTRAPIDFAAMMGPRRDYVAMHATQVFERQVLLEFGGFDGRTLIGADTELNWRLLRFTAAGNVPRVLYTRRLHPASLTRDAATCHGSPRRQMYVAERDRRHLEIANALAAGNLARVRDLCTEDLYHADIDIREMHSGFDIALKA
jgi:hypothetical protein